MIVAIFLMQCNSLYSNSWHHLPFSGSLNVQFQYGNPDKLCKPLVDAKKAGEDLVVWFALLYLFIHFWRCAVCALTPLPDAYAKYKWVVMFSSWKLYNSIYRMHMPNMSKSTTLEPLVSLQKVMTRNIWKKLQSMKTVLLGYGGFKFALKLRTFRWLPQMIAYVPQKLTQSNFLISTIRFWTCFFSLASY